MRITNNVVLFALVLVIVGAVLGACSDTGKSGNRTVTTLPGSDKSDGGGSAGASVAGDDKPCPDEADISAAIGAQVQKKPYGTGCYYEAPDIETNVSMMRIAPSRTDQLLEEMRTEARQVGTDVTPIDVGERGYAWAAARRGFGFTVAGNQAYMLDVSGKKGVDMKAAVIKILKMMLS